MLKVISTNNYNAEIDTVKADIRIQHTINQKKKYIGSPAVRPYAKNNGTKKYRFLINSYKKNTIIFEINNWFVVAGIVSKN